MTQLPNRLPTVSFNSAEPTQPLVILLFDDGLRVTPKKWGEDCLVLAVCVYRFLSIRMITSPTARIAMITPIVAGKK